MKHDYLIRVLGANEKVRGFAVDTKGIVEHARLIHHNTPLASAILGRLMSAGLMMGQMLKSKEDKLTVQLLGDGPFKHAIITSNLAGTVRGYVSNPGVELPLRKDGHLDVSRAIGSGSLTVIRDMGLKDPYVSSIDLTSGEIAEDLTYYFAQSEQTPSSVGLGVLVDVDQTILASGGFLLQLMPNTDQKTIDQLEKNIKNFVGVTPYLSQGHSLEEMMDVLFEGFDHEVTDTMDVSWKCNCSFERGKEVLATLKRDEIVNMIEEGKPVEVNCDFCQSHYRYDIEDLKEVLSHIDEQAK